ncbi:hypothetical protein DFH27DRAFT_631235 [Peziza echinospora]|nr:hypothetical protein DFH27DRAFT_631235 [Peziza echinospora]
MVEDTRTTKNVEGARKYIITVLLAHNLVQEIYTAASDKDTEYIYYAHHHDENDPSSDLAQLISMPRGRNSIRLLGDYAFYLAIKDTVGFLESQLHSRDGKGKEKQLDDCTNIPLDLDADIPDAETNFLLFIHALTRFSRWVIVTRYHANLSATLPKTREDYVNKGPLAEKNHMHIDNLIRHLDGVYYPLVLKERRAFTDYRPQDKDALLLMPADIPPRPRLRPEQEGLITELFTHPDSFGEFDVDLAYHVFVTRQVGALTVFYRELADEYTVAIEDLARANQVYEKIRDIFWPVSDDIWLPSQNSYNVESHDEVNPPKKVRFNLLALSTSHVNGFDQKRKRLRGESGGNEVEFPVVTPLEKQWYRPGRMGPKMVVGVRELLEYTDQFDAVAAAVVRTWGVELD